MSLAVTLGQQVVCVRPPGLHAVPFTPWQHRNDRTARVWMGASSWVLMRLKDRWVQRLLDQRAKSSPTRALSREIDQVLLPLSSVISWVVVVVRAPTPCSLEAALLADQEAMPHGFTPVAAAGLPQMPLSWTSSSA